MMELIAGGKLYTANGGSVTVTSEAESPEAHKFRTFQHALSFLVEAEPGAWEIRLTGEELASFIGQTDIEFLRIDYVTGQYSFMGNFHRFDSCPYRINEVINRVKGLLDKEMEA